MGTGEVVTRYPSRPGIPWAAFLFSAVLPICAAYLLFGSWEEMGNQDKIRLVGVAMALGISVLLEKPHNKLAELMPGYVAMRSAGETRSEPGRAVDFQPGEHLIPEGPRNEWPLANAAATESDLITGIRNVAVIGNDDRIEFTPEVAAAVLGVSNNTATQYIRAIGVIKRKAGLDADDFAPGTGTLVLNTDLVVTAGHLFFSKKTDRLSQDWDRFEFVDYDPVTDEYRHFGIAHAWFKDALSLITEHKLASMNNNLDQVIVRLDRPITDAIPFGIRDSQSSIAPSEVLYMAAFHEDKDGGWAPYLSYGHLLAPNAHDLDTTGKSSGGAIFQPRPTKIVAISVAAYHPLGSSLEKLPGKDCDLPTCARFPEHSPEYYNVTADLKTFGFPKLIELTHSHR